MQKKKIALGMYGGFVLMVLLVNVAQATVVVSSKSDSGLAYPYDQTINRDAFMTDDLISGLTPAISGGVYSNIAGTYAQLNNGTGGTGWIFQTNGSTNPMDKAVIVDYTMDTSVNTAGYDISEIRFFTGDPTSRLFQNYDVYVRYVGESGNASHLINANTKIPGSNYGDLASNYGDGQETIMSDDMEALIATGVDQLRFILYTVYIPTDTGVFSDPASYNTKSSPRMQEIDVLGSATPIPEPTTMMISIIGTIIVTLKRRVR